jgi:hypothetical protein
MHSSSSSSDGAATAVTSAGTTAMWMGSMQHQYSQATAMAAISRPACC